MYIITFSLEYICIYVLCWKFEIFALFLAHSLNASLHFIVVNGVAEYYDSTYSFFFYLPRQNIHTTRFNGSFCNELFSQTIIVVSHAAKFIL